jgi:hypothetical protein
MLHVVLAALIGVAMGCRHLSSGGTSSSGRYNYAFLEMSRITGGRWEYRWVDPANPSPARRFVSDGPQLSMAEQFGLDPADFTDAKLVNHLSEQGWRLISVEREWPRELEKGAVLPYFKRYHFQRPVGIRSELGR